MPKRFGSQKPAVSPPWLLPAFSEPPAQYRCCQRLKQKKRYIQPAQGFDNIASDSAVEELHTAQISSRRIEFMIREPLTINKHCSNDQHSCIHSPHPNNENLIEFYYIIDPALVSFIPHRSIRFFAKTNINFCLIFDYCVICR